MPLMRAERHSRPLPLEAVTLLTEGRLSDAIRAVRDADHVSNREARKRINAHLEGEPLLRVQLETQRRAARARLFFWFLLVDLVIVAAIIGWMYYRGAI
jgi:hypothetical protein